MNSSEYEYLQTKKWRAITYDFDKLYSMGQDSKLYCLTDFQAAWLLSNTEYMRWQSRWLNCNCTQAELDALKADLDFNLMSCIDYLPYQVDFIYQQAVQQEIDRLEALWDGVNPSSVNPNTPDDFYNGDDSQDRNRALCTAVKVYIYSYAENWVAKTQVALGVAVVVGLFASITLVGGSIATLLIAGLAYASQLALDAMKDNAALDNVVCCMVNGLDGQATTQANWEASLNACGFMPGTNEAIIRDIIASDLNQIGNWLSFLNSLGNSYVLAQNGVYDCPCDAPPPCVNVETSFVPLQTGRGQYVGGEWTAQYYTDGGNQYRGIDIIWTPTINSYNGYRYIQVDFDWLVGTGYVVNDLVIRIAYGGTPKQDYLYPNPANGSYSICVDLDTDNPQQQIRLLFRCAKNSNNGNVTITNIELCQESDCI